MSPSKALGKREAEKLQCLEEGLDELLDLCIAPILARPLVLEMPGWMARNLQRKEQDDDGEMPIGG